MSFIKIIQFLQQGKSENSPLSKSQCSDRGSHIFFLAESNYWPFNPPRKSRSFIWLLAVLQAWMNRGSLSPPKLHLKAYSETAYKERTMAVWRDEAWNACQDFQRYFGNELN